MKVYVLGDSISIHYGVHLGKYLHGRFEISRKESDEEALLNLDNPQGANGGDSSMVLAFLKSKIELCGIDSDLILINCGLHDFRIDKKTGSYQIPINTYVENLKLIVEETKKIKPEMVWVRTTPCDENVHNKMGKDFHRFSKDCSEYNLAADQVMETNKIPSIDLFTFTNNLGTDIYRDHVHFYEHICEKQAAFIAGWLNAYIDGIN